LGLFCIKTITKLLSFVRCKGAEAQRHRADNLKSEMWDIKSNNALLR